MENTNEVKSIDQSLTILILIEAIINGVERSVAQTDFILVNDRSINIAEPTPSELIFVPKIELSMSVLSTIAISRP